MSNIIILVAPTFKFNICIPWRAMKWQLALVLWTHLYHLLLNNLDWDCNWFDVKSVPKEYMESSCNGKSFQVNCRGIKCTHTCFSMCLGLCHLPSTWTSGSPAVLCSGSWRFCHVHNFLICIWITGIRNVIWSLKAQYAYPWSIC